MFNKGGNYKFIVAILWIFLLLNFAFYSLKSVRAQNVIINEVAWMGTLNSYNDEWIELYNQENYPIDLGGWILETEDKGINIILNGVIKAKSYFLLERSDDNSVSSLQADLIYTGSLSNDGEILYLKSASSTIIDKIDASSGWPAGDNNKKLTMEYSGLDWQNSLVVGGSPKATNTVINISSNIDDGQDNKNDNLDANVNSGNNNQDLQDLNSVNNSQIDVCQTVSVGEIVINEFVSDPSDDDVEWIELYNNTHTNVDLSGWIIEDASGAKTLLNKQISGFGFIAIENPKGKLNNKGDIIILRDCRGNLIDKVVYGSLSNSNLPAPRDPYSLARKIDGYNTFNNAQDFALAEPTKASANIIILEDEEQDYSSGDIIISEILPNPIGPDHKGEFIELYNNSDNNINLLNWRLSDSSKRQYIIKEEVILKPKSYFVIWRPQSRIVLNNSKDEISLYAPNSDKPIQLVKYKDAPEGASYNATSSPPIYFWSEVPTPGKDNIIKNKNHPPLVDFDCPKETLVGKPIIFDSSDTVDDDGDELRFFWDFGDGIINYLPMPEHTFLKAGNYAVKLVVSDGRASTSLEKIIKVKPKEIVLAKESSNYFIPNIIISEIMPNPVGRDKDEWVELYNQEDFNVNLGGWQLKNSKQRFVFPKDFFLKPLEFKIIDRKQSSLALINKGDKIQLLDNYNNLVDEINYGNAPDGLSYIYLDNNKWVWTIVPTPNKENIYKSVQNYNKPKIIKNNNLSSTKNLNSLILTKDKSKNTFVKIRGIVLSRPGTISSQYFYVFDKIGVQVYNYKKDFPEIKRGDLIEVYGRVSYVNGELRIKAKNKNDIKIINYNQEIEIKAVNNEEIDEELLGQLVRIQGELIDKKGSSIYLDDGTDEVKVYVKKTTGIKLANFKKGNNLIVTGIVSADRNGLRILPRSEEDISLLDDSLSVNDEIILSKQGYILGASTEQDKWSLPPEKENFGYILISLIAGIILIGGLFIKLKFKN